MKNINVSITIDVENPQTPLFQKRFSDNRIWSNGFGIEKIVETLDKYKIQGSFFSNVYEYPFWGKREIRKFVKYLYNKGHDVELHTHPIWMDEKRREHMFQFSLAEQIAMLKWGIDFIEETIGEPPQCHRAGAYGINKNTLKACEGTEIIADSSYFEGHPFCRYSLSPNRIGFEQGLIEFPITFISNNGKPTKTDINWMSLSDFKLFTKLVNNTPDMNFINLFMHSYSFTKTHDNFKSYEPDYDTLAKFETLLKWFSDQTNIRFITLRQYAKEILIDGKKSKNIIEERNKNKSIPAKEHSKIELIEKEPVEVVFVKRNPNVRVYKQAKCLKLLNKYHLKLLAQPLDFSLFKDIFDEIIIFEDLAHLAIIVKDLDSNLFHVQPNPNSIPYTVMTNTKAPVIYDATDYVGIKEYSLEKMDPVEREMEKYCLENATGLVRKASPYEIDFYRQRGYKIGAPELHWLDYCDEDLFSDCNKKLSESDREIHLVYTGNIAPNLDKGYVHLYYPPIAEIFANQKMHLHIYPNPYHFDNAPEYEELSKNEKYFHFHKPVPYKKLSQEISKFDWGIWIHPVFGKDFIPRTNIHSRKIGMGNKFFTYLEAGLPVIVSEHLEYGTHLAKKFNIGFGIQDNELKNLRKMIDKQDYNDLRNNVLKTRKIQTLNNKAPKIDHFYYKFLANQ